MCAVQEARRPKEKFQRVDRVKHLLPAVSWIIYVSEMVYYTPDSCLDFHH